MTEGVHQLVDDICFGIGELVGIIGIDGGEERILEGVGLPVG